MLVPGRGTSWGLLLLVLLLLAGPARAEAGLARDDLDLSRLLAGQETALAEALRAVEDRAAGRLGAEESRAAVQAALARVEDLERKVRQRAARADGALAEPAQTLAADRLRQAVQARNLVAREVLSREAVARFGRGQAGLAADSLAGWMRARLEVARRVARAKPTGVAAYYGWQSRVLPLQLEEVGLAGEVREALQKAGEGGGSAGLASRGRDLAARVAAVKAPPGLEKAQAAAAREGESLARLAEAADLMARDPTEDSASRVNRWGRKLQQDSAAASKESLEALSRALGG